jgi:DNA-binding GntR family transcriptional regulator
MPRDTSLTREAYDRLRADVLACRLKPGERLNIKDLCETLSVSLGAVREALSRLTSDGFVLAEPQRGFRVAPISAADLLDLTQARIELEGACLRRAIAHGDVAWESELAAAYHQLSRTPRRALDDARRLSDDFFIQHEAFHAALVAGCDSQWLLRLRADLYAQNERYQRLAVPLERAERNVEAEHEQLFQAALRRDADGAVRAIAAHIETTATILLDALPAEIDRAPRRRDGARKGG